MKIYLFFMQVAQISRFLFVKPSIFRDLNIILAWSLCPNRLFYLKIIFYFYKYWLFSFQKEDIIYSYGKAY